MPLTILTSPKCCPGAGLSGRLSGVGVADSRKISNPGTPGGLVDCSFSLSDCSLGLV